MDRAGSNPCKRTRDEQSTRSLSSLFNRILPHYGSTDNSRDWGRAFTTVVKRRCALPLHTARFSAEGMMVLKEEDRATVWRRPLRQGRFSKELTQKMRNLLAYGTEAKMGLANRAWLSTRRAFQVLLLDFEGEIRHGLFVVVHSRSFCAQFESALFAASHLFLLFIPVLLHSSLHFTTRD